MYVGFYVDVNDNFILKIGTTNNLERRQAEHIRNYRKAKRYTMPEDEIFHYLWHLPLSKYNTLRYEDENRQRWKEMNIGIFIPNDRFLCESPPPSVPVGIHKTYTVFLPEWVKYW